MQAFLQNMIEYAHQISLKWHMLLGFIMGAGPFSYFADRWQDAVFAFLLGGLSAGGAGIVKMVIENYVTRRKNKNKNAGKN